MQRRLGLGLQGFRKVVEHVRRLVHPAPLLPGFGKDFPDGRPESERTIAHRELRGDRQAAALEPEEHLSPALFGFAHPVLDRQELLLAELVHADDHQRAQPLVFGPEPRIDPIDPHVHPAVAIKFRAAPLPVLLHPATLEPRDRRGRKPRRLGAQKRRQRLMHVARGNAVQVKPRQRRLHAPRAAHVRRHQRRAEHRRLLAPRARLRHLHRHRPQPGENLALGLKAVANNRPTAVHGALPGVARQKVLELRPHRLRNEVPGAFAKHRAQEILLLLWPAKLNYRILLHRWRDSLKWVAETRSRQSHSSRSRRLPQLIAVHQIRL